MADAEVRQVIRDGGGIGEAKPGMKLNAVSGTEIIMHERAPSGIVNQL